MSPRREVAAATVPESGRAKDGGRTMAEPVALRAFHTQVMKRKPVEIVKNR